MQAQPAPNQPLLDVRGLRVGFAAGDGTAWALDGVDLQVARGERVGIVGESGSGKSQWLLAIMGLLAPQAVVAGSVRLAGQELIGLPERELDQLRGAQVAMVFQDPMTALNPYLRIGTQLTEVLQHHKGLSRAAADATAVQMLQRLGIADAAARMRRYPHEFSGGMRQRVMIAMALLAEPALLLADEPTTALDVTVQAQILDLLHGLTRTLGTGLVLVTHDLGVVARLCERVVVLYGGRVMESGPIDALYASPQHPYTQALLASTPRMDTAPGLRMPTIAGQPRGDSVGTPLAGSADASQGCPFAARCPRADALCRNAVPPQQALSGRTLACHHAMLGDMLQDVPEALP